MKTFNMEDIISWYNHDEAEKYIGKEGYFADTIEALKNYVERNIIEILGEIDPDNSECFTVNYSSYGKINYSFFLPAEKVKEVEEKKWRPFRSIDEFKNKTGLDLLHIVHYRLTSNGSIVSTGYGVITDFCTSGDKTDYITIGDTSFNLNELFNYEYKDDNEWKPFGVLENES